ncbi:Metalloprotease TldD [Vibrio sp. B1FIG11]|nr:Metalloprotease TldD [Vibrio sp. B1FIG11]CAE6924637.1 Metalloprotease TldD [Vibrio sp. B1FIG11]
MSINQIEQALFAPNGLTEQDIADTLASIATRQIDYADIYFQSSWHESLVLEDSIIKDGSFNIDCGVGVRAVTGEKTGFAYSDQIQLEGLKQSAIAARGIAQQGQNGKVHAFKRSDNQAYYDAVNPLASWEKQQKTELLLSLDAYIRTKEPLIKKYLSASAVCMSKCWLLQPTVLTLVTFVRLSVYQSVFLLKKAIAANAVALVAVVVSVTTSSCLKQTV